MVNLDTLDFSFTHINGFAEVLKMFSCMDRLDDRLKDLEEQLDSADEPTKQILQQSAQLWLGDQNFATNEDDENGPFRDTSSSSASHQKKT